ncbi:hypothetical protein pipiens_008953 [Culex pipiens pipiens]|uniref:Uncharacterized protein n=1 Tax=Culex pipiens pipiens TaxID=38569 RepID=A0ABD1DFJ3_CULPP
MMAFTKFIKTGIADKNDYPLYFEKVIYEADIEENVEVNHNFLNVTAKTPAEEMQTQSSRKGQKLANIVAVGIMHHPMLLNYTHASTNIAMSTDGCHHPCPF